MVKVSRWTMVTLAGALAGIGLLVSGCSPTDMKVDVTREEYMGLIYRTYENVEPEKVLAAAERLLRLADEEDITFQHSEDGFRAYRKWLLYAIITARWGTDTWDIKVKPAGDGTKATVQIWTSLEGQALPMAIGAGWGAVPAPGTGSAPTQSPGLYDIFWARMDYLLGLREDWMTCSESDARIISGIVRGSNGQLCSITVEDRVPGEYEGQQSQQSTGSEHTKPSSSTRGDREQSQSDAYKLCLEDVSGRVPDEWCEEHAKPSSSTRDGREQSQPDAYKLCMEDASGRVPDEWCDRFR